MTDYYQLMLDTLAKQDQNNKKRLLLHSCCAPCNAWVVLYLSDYFDLTLYFNNSNIYPQQEFTRRLDELKRFIREAKLDIPIIETPYDPRYMQQLEPLRDEPEGQRRCHWCYEVRMRQAYQYADDNQFDYFTTVMSVSRHKNSKVLNQIGERLSQQYQTPYFYSDFKKGEGMRNSQAVSNQYDFYRQNYCGCVFSIRHQQDLTLDYLPFTSIYLYQRKDMFRLNTDTRLLGEFMRINAGESVLDVGCNNGALMLYANQYHPSQMVGIDLFSEAIELAQQNMLLNGITNVSFHQINVKDYQNAEYDVIICNPPYFPYHNAEFVNDNPFLVSARHLSEITLHELLYSLKRLIKPQGRIYLVYRYDFLNNLKQELTNVDLNIVRECHAIDPRDQQVKSVLLELSRTNIIELKLESVFI